MNQTCLGQDRVTKGGSFDHCVRVETECDGTRKRTGGEVKGKKANWGGSQQSCTVSDTVYPALLPLMRTPRLPAVDWTDTPADINGLVRFAGKPNLVSARVPSRSISALPPSCSTKCGETLQQSQRADGSFRRILLTQFTCYVHRLLYSKTLPRL